MGTVPALSAVHAAAAVPLGALTGTFGSPLIKSFEYSDEEERLIPQITMAPHAYFLLVLQSCRCHPFPFTGTLTFVWVTGHRERSPGAPWSGKG